MVQKRVGTGSMRTITLALIVSTALHLVLGPRDDGMPVRFQVRIDGHVPGADHGSDTDAAGNGIISDARLYQLVRQSGQGQGIDV